MSCVKSVTKKYEEKYKLKFIILNAICLFYFVGYLTMLW
jgi:hypothetical protein